MAERREWSRLVFGGLLNKLPAHSTESTLPLFQVSLSLVLLLPFLSLSFLPPTDRPPTVTYDSDPRLVRGVRLCVYTVQQQVRRPSALRGGA